MSKAPLQNLSHVLVSPSESMPLPAAMGIRRHVDTLARTTRQTNGLKCDLNSTWLRRGSASASPRMQKREISHLIAATLGSVA